MEIAIMIEGQNGLNWSRWQRIAQVTEDLGFDGLFRSDHFTNANPPDKDSLELWTSLTWLADHTEWIVFGPLVTPLSFRNPVQTARMALAVDDLSNGRLILGLGAGWQAREHQKFGFELLEVPERMERFEEGVEVISRLLHSTLPVGYRGDFYTLDEAILYPRPARPGGPPILIGGTGRARTLQLVARFADEWNAAFIPIEEFASLNRHLDRLLEERGREPSEVRRSFMNSCIFGTNESEVNRKVEERTSGRRSQEELRERGAFVGTGEDILDQIDRLEEAGAQMVMLQWLDLDDLESLEAMAKVIIS
jgi:F420-dependent oxidoreductase-like protein